MKAKDKQVGGDHYKMAIQPVEFIVKNRIPFIEGNVIKYVVRHGKKNGEQDIDKAIHYLNLLKEIEYTGISKQKSWSDFLKSMLPMPESIRNVEIKSGALYFDWMNQRYRLKHGSVEMVISPGITAGTKVAMLLTHILF